MTKDDKKYDIEALAKDAPISSEQKAWLGGYFAGVEDSVAMSEAGSDNGGIKTHILFGSQTGNAENVAHDLGSAINGTVLDMADVSVDDFKSFENIIIITSTYGEGEHPDNGLILWDAVQSVDKIKCDFAVLGLGDTAYDLFCKSAEDWDNFLSSKGGNKKLDILRLDVDYEEQANEWIGKVKELFNSSSADSTPKQADKPTDKPKPHKSIYTKSNPYMGEFLTNELLSKNGSDKQVHHFEFEVNDPEMAYESGDAMGVIPLNSEKLINDILTASGLDGNKEIDGKKLSEILMNEKEIRNPNKDFIKVVAEKSKSPELEKLLADKKEMDNYLWGREIIDFLNDYAVKFTEQEFVELMKPLQHRLYSISSSPNAHKGEVHLTVAAVKYKFNDRDCEGVASCFLADRLKTGEKVGLFMHPNKAFSIPDDDTVPMIMVGPGTGIAPFRAFMEERIVKGATGDNWLFFGDRTKKDYLYQDTLEQWEKDGKVRLSLAWSREEGIDKTYVQDLMLKDGKDLFNALEKGGYFFVCGDASRMAKDVEATLLEVISTHGAMSIEKATDYLKTLKKQKRYVRDVY